MKTKREYPEIELGVVNGKRIFLCKPVWTTSGSWRFGFLKEYEEYTNKWIRSYTIEGMEKEVVFHEKFIRHFKSSFIVKDIKQVFKLSELFYSFYIFKNVEEVYRFGGTYISENPCKEFIENKSESNKINQIILPEIFEAIYSVLEEYR
jgi:hypothetical protein